MAKSLADLRHVKADTPPIMLAYGKRGMGKTTFGSEWPDPVFIQCERGEPGGPKGPKLVSFGEIETFNDVMTAIASLWKEEHSFKTLVVDTLDKLEPLIWAQVCEENKWKTPEDAGYGKGYVVLDYAWREFMKACVGLKRQLGMAVVLLAQGDVFRFDSPTSNSYHQWTLKIQKRAAAIVQEDADIVGFFSLHESVREQDVGFKKTVSRAVSNGERIIFFEERPSYTAKNRYGMPSQIDYHLGAGYSAVAPYFPQPTGVLSKTA